MEILVVTPDFPPKCGGIGNLSFNYCTYSHLGIDILTENKSGLEELSLPRNRQIFTVEKMTGLKGLWNCKSFFQSVPKDYDGIYFMHPLQSVLGSFLQTNYIVHSHGQELILPGPAGKLMQQLAKLGMRRSDGIIANSDWTRDQIKKMGITEEKINQIPPGLPPGFANGYNENHLRNEKEISSNTPIILTVGRLDKRKGHDLVIKSIRDLNVEYFICGSGETEQKLKSLVKSEKISDRVHFEGYVPDAELGKYYAGSDLFVMPSKRLADRVEGFGIVFLEANSFGLPVIGGSTGGIPSAINHMETGLLTQPNVKHVRKNIERLLSDEELCNNISNNAKEWAERHYWDKIASETDDFVRDNIIQI